MCDDRFAVNTINQFAVLEQSAQKIPSQHGSRGYQTHLNGNYCMEYRSKSSPAFAGFHETPPHLPFFTIKQLDNQF